jgi:hypothetical protein
MGAHDLAAQLRDHPERVEHAPEDDQRDDDVLAAPVGRPRDE